MSKSWILDVLADLKSFAAQNELPILAAELDELVVVAMAEIATEGGPGDYNAGEIAYGQKAKLLLGNFRSGKDSG